MKDVFLASLFHEGVLGGAVYLLDDKLLYRTNKLTVEMKYRSLELPYSGIEYIETGWALFFPTVTFSLKNGIRYRFIVFSRKKFLSRLAELRKQV